MCNVCCKEFSGWCRSFTRTEGLLSILEGLLLTAFILLLVFLLLHLIVCPVSREDLVFDKIDTSTISSKINKNKQKVIILSDISPEVKPIKSTITSVDPAHKCTWKPQEKTKATTHFYYIEEPVTYQSNTESTDESDTKIGTILVLDDKQDKLLSNITNNYDNDLMNDDVKNHTQINPSSIELGENHGGQNISNDIDTMLENFASSDEEVVTKPRRILALVKLKPPSQLIFGCTLTVVSEYWTVTAASCIESIEEVDSLDSFVMIETFGEDIPGDTHAVTDIQIHPLYQGTNHSYDIVALKSEGSLIKRDLEIVHLPSMLDYLIMTIGEPLTVFGYGRFRSVDTSPAGRALRKAIVYRLPSTQCAATPHVWSFRHLTPTGGVSHEACGAAPICTGVLAARTAPCTYCAGTPLLRGALLLGLMADNSQCGVACEPLVYVNIAMITDWLDVILTAE